MTSPSTSSRRARALVIDDSKSMRLIIARVLRDLGFDILEAADGKEALGRLNEGEDIDLILVDWNMPVMNGYEFVRAVRSNPMLGCLPIMMVTTESSAAQVQSALQAGASEYLMKPFSKEMLLEKLALLGLDAACTSHDPQHTFSGRQ